MTWKVQKVSQDLVVAWTVAPRALAPVFLFLHTLSRHLSTESISSSRYMCWSGLSTACCCESVLHEHQCAEVNRVGKHGYLVGQWWLCSKVIDATARTTAYISARSSDFRIYRCMASL